MEYNIANVDLFHDDAGETIFIEKGKEMEHVQSRIDSWRVKKDTGMLDEIRVAEEMIDEENDDEQEEDELNVTDMGENEIVHHWREHLYNVVLSRNIKSNSQEIANDHKRVATYCCFDLQQVLDSPYTNVGDAFYKRQLSCYNFVVNDDTEKKGYCYFWSQDEGNRGANEMASNFILFAKSKAEEGKKCIMAFCDRCGGQNRNRPIAAALSYIVENTSIQSIMVCYLEKGHTENAADTIHSMMEGEKVCNVQVPNEWPVIFKQMNLKKVEICVKELTHKDVLDVKQWTTNFPNWYRDKNGEKVINWMQVKIVKARKSDPFTIFFKMKYNDREFQKIELLQKGGKRKISHVEKSSIPEKIKKAYKSRIPISIAKYDDLLSMCEDGIIEEKHRGFYENLPHE